MQEELPIRHVPDAMLCIAGTSFMLNGRKHAALSFVVGQEGVRSPGASTTGSPQPGDSIDDLNADVASAIAKAAAKFTVSNGREGLRRSRNRAAHSGPPLDQLRLHWGCVAGLGDKWCPPPAGWHTQPSESKDAGDALGLVGGGGG